MKTLILFYSSYGHIYEMSKAIKKGAEQIPGNEVIIKRVPETLSDEILKKAGAYDFQNKIKNIPVCNLEDLEKADVIFFGTPTRYGNMCGQMTMAEISGCSPYGASTICGGKGERMPSANELSGAEFQGQYAASIALKLTQK